MAIARFKDLCIDSSAKTDLGRFYAAALGLSFEDDGEAGVLVGDQPEKRIWMNVVPEPKTVKHRVHFDIHTASLDELERLGARVHTRGEEHGWSWTVMLDPEDGEFCAFVRERDKLPSYRLYEVGVDAADPRSVAEWWHDVLGGELSGDTEHGWWALEPPQTPFESLVFAGVPEPKSVKNRIHWDVVGDVDELREAGAAVLAEPTAESGWTVMADPEGNEFCVFTE